MCILNSTSRLLWVWLRMHHPVCYGTTLPQKTWFFSTFEQFSPKSTILNYKNHSRHIFPILEIDETVSFKMEALLAMQVVGISFHTFKIRLKFWNWHLCPSYVLGSFLSHSDCFFLSSKLAIGSQTLLHFLLYSLIHTSLDSTKF